MSVACGNGAFSHDFSPEFPLEDWCGDAAMTGTIRLASPLTEPTSLILWVEHETLGLSLRKGTGVSKSPVGTNRIRYRLLNTAPGTIRIGVSAKDTANNTDTVLGWYDGTGAAPILEELNATPISLTTGCTEDVDFGVSAAP